MEAFIKRYVENNVPDRGNYYVAEQVCWLLFGKYVDALYFIFPP